MKKSRKITGLRFRYIPNFKHPNPESN